MNSRFASNSPRSILFCGWTLEGNPRGKPALLPFDPIGCKVKKDTMSDAYADCVGGSLKLKTAAGGVKK